MASRTRYPGDLEAARIRARAARRRRSRSRFLVSVVVLVVGAALVATANLVFLHWRAHQPTAGAAAPHASAPPVPTPAPPPRAPPPPAPPGDLPTQGKDIFPDAPRR